MIAQEFQGRQLGSELVFSASLINFLCTCSHTFSFVNVFTYGARFSKFINRILAPVLATLSPTLSPILLQHQMTAHLVHHLGLLLAVHPNLPLPILHRESLFPFRYDH
jgi:hypothetical protein